MTRDAAGLVYLVSSRFTPLVFDPSRSSLRLLAGRGSGPGEYQTATRILLRRSGLPLLLDPSQLRATTFRTAGSVESSFRLPAHMATEVALLGDSLLVYNASIATAGSVGLPFHLIDLRGQLRRSFGPEVDIRRVQDEERMRYRLASAASGGFWSARELRYELSLWRADGSLQRSLERRPEWFRGADEFVRPTSEAAFTPFITAVREDAAGRVWLLIAVPSKNFRAGLGAPIRRADGRMRYPVESHAKLYDTVIEVLDVRANRLVLSQRVSGYLAYLLDDHHAASYTEDEDGTPVLSIVRLGRVGF